jgi:hypothetical protein
MNAKEVAVTNAVIFFFTMNFNSTLLQRYRDGNPEFSFPYLN